MSEETREMLLERFKAHLSRSASHSIDNEKKRFELRPDASGAHYIGAFEADDTSKEGV